MNKTRSIGIVLLFLGILASSFTGTDESGIHSECQDGIDNDSSANSPFIYGTPQVISIEQGTDGQDQNCLFYPYADGNGEDSTPSSEQYQRSGEYPSLLEYHQDYGSTWAVCHGLRFSGEPVGGNPPLVIANPMYNGQEVADATLWIQQQTGFPSSSSLGCQ